jgi:hypothetical protein
MTLSDITGRIITRIDDNAGAPVSVTEAEAIAAVNEGEQLFSWLTLCLETTLPITIAANATFGVIRSTFPDFLVPLRIAIAGVRLRPATLGELDAQNDQWQATAGLPTRYAQLGFNFWAITPQPTFSMQAQATYARSPVLLVNPTDTPEIPEQYHPALVAYGRYRTKLKEGAQGLQRGLGEFADFMDAAKEHGDFVRARSRAASFDTLPFEMKLFDRARLVTP